MSYKSNGIHQKQVFIKTMNAIALEQPKPGFIERTTEILTSPSEWFSNWVMDAIRGSLSIFGITVSGAIALLFLRLLGQSTLSCLDKITDDGVKKTIKDFFIKLFGGVPQPPIPFRTEEQILKIKQQYPYYGDLIKDAQEKTIKRVKQEQQDCLKKLFGAANKAVIALISFNILGTMSESESGISSFLQRLFDGGLPQEEYLTSLAAAFAAEGEYSISSSVLLEYLKQSSIDVFSSMSDAEMYTIGVALSVLIAALAVVAGVPAAISSGIAALIAALQSVGLAAGPAAGAILEALRQMFPQYASQLVIP